MNITLAIDIGILTIIFLLVVILMTGPNRKD
jgi:hypothetical protein